MKYAVAFGNPFDGIAVYGPFDTREDADKYAENADGDYWIIELQNPELG